MIVDFNNTPYKVKELNALKRHDFGRVVHFCRSGRVQKPTNVIDFVKRQNGLTIEDDEDCYRVYTDPFRTIPAFVVKDVSGRLSVFTDFEQIYDAPDVDMAFDPAGFWEILLFEGGLWSRTLYQNVKQLPGASCLTIDKKDGTFDIQRYWDFFIPEDRGISDDKSAIDGFYERLATVIGRLDADGDHVLGLSGGLDSRLTLALLSERVDKRRVRLFTYGFDPRILEYRFAKSVADALGFRSPDFHLLTADSYRRAIFSLPKLSGGQIGIQHCHMYDYLTIHQHDLANHTNLSTYYSDAAFGWDTWPAKKDNRLEDSSYFRALDAVDDLDPKVREAIEDDVARVLSGYNSEANYSSIDEYKYVVERNQKFHLYLAYLQGKIVPSIPLFANYDLLEYCISVPVRLRAQKRLVDGVLKSHFPQVALECVHSVSSRHYRGGPYGSGTDTGLGPWLVIRTLNRLNALMRVATKGTLQIRNIYLTEEHDRLLYRYFRDDLSEACDALIRYGLLNESQGGIRRRLPLRAKGGGRLALIGLAALVGNGVPLQQALA